MSTSQGLGIIGAAVGAFVGGPAGAQWGYAIGSTVGSIIDPEVIKGPDLGDAKQQTSQAGIPIVKVYGMPAPFAGTLIDGDKISRPYTKREQQGKGGPIVETPGFKATRAILVCEGEVDFARIWRNNKLVYSTIAGDTLDADSAAFASQMRLYRGTETQLPDPSLEAIHGVGNTPYYRGRAYMVVIDDDETQSGGAANQYLFQVTDCADITPATGGTLLVAGQATAPTSNPCAAYGTNPAALTTIPYTSLTLRSAVPAYGNGGWTLATRAASAYTSDLSAAWSNGTAPNLGGSTNDATFGDGSFLQVGSVGGGNFVFSVSVDWGATYLQATSAFTDGAGYVACDFGGGRFLVAESANYGRLQYSDDGGASFNAIPGTFGSFNPWGDISSYPNDLGNRSGTWAAAITGTSPGVWTSTDAGENWDKKVTADSSVNGIAPGMGGAWCAVCESGDVLITDNDWASYTVVAGALPAASSYGRMVFTGIYYITYSPGSTLYYSADRLVWTSVNPGVGVITGTATSFSGYAGISAPDAPAYYVDTDGNQSGPSGASLVSCGAVWREIALDIASRTPCPTSKLDVANMDDEVPGFILARADLSGNDYLRALCGPYFATLPEYDGQLHAIRFGGASVATLTNDDLLEIEDDDDNTRKQVIEAPARVTLAYPDPANNYVVTPQTARRSVPDIQSTGEKTVQTVIPFSADQSAQIADKMQKVDWTRVQGGFTRALTAKWSKLVPSDAITWTDGQRYIIDRARYEDSMITIECTHDRISDYQSSVSGVNAPPPTGQTSNIKGPTILAVMNLPSLKSSDNVPGVYVAIQGLLPGYPGCDLYLSVDNGATEQFVLSITDQAVIGELAEACDADGADSTGLISVQVYVGGELASITDAQLAARQNGFALVTADVAEIGQFKDATETSTERLYDLTNVTRGELGTTAAAHAAGDRFVLLDGAVKFLPIDIQYAGQTLIFRAVTKGTMPANNGETMQSVVFDPPTIVYTGGDSTT